MRQNQTEIFINELASKKSDILVRTLSSKWGWIKLCYIKQLTDRKELMEYVIKPLVEYQASPRGALSAEYAMENVIYADKCTLETDLGKAELYILEGKTVIFFSADSGYLAVDINKSEHRAVEEPDMLYSFRGGRDAFVENLDVNLSLLRYRLKDGNLRIEKMQVGERTKSTVAVVYISDIVNPSLPEEVKKRISAIKTDGIVESGELQNYLLNNKKNLFPQMGMVPRSDLAAAMLLEGKVIIFVDGSGIALQAPKVFTEFLYSSDDRYENKYYGLFTRVLRFIAFFLSITMTSFYIAVAYYTPELMPPAFIVSLAQARSNSPFDPFLGVLTIEFAVELMRESLFRVPLKVGSVVAVVGAIIIGQAATSSGIYSPQLLIFIALEFLASFTIPDISFSNSFRVTKLIVIVFTGIIGIYGMAFALFLILMNLVSINTFGIPYTAPYAPLNRYDFLRIWSPGKKSSPKRPKYMRNNDDTRQ